MKYIGVKAIAKNLTTTARQIESLTATEPLEYPGVKTIGKNLTTTAGQIESLTGTEPLEYPGVRVTAEERVLQRPWQHLQRVEVEAAKGGARQVGGVGGG